MSDARTLAGRLVAVGGAELHVREDGPPNGVPLVLLHGFASSMHWFDRMIPLLDNEFRLIRIDLLGHGGSAKPRRGYSPEEQAAVVRAVLGALEITEATVLGHSLGADVAIALAERDPLVRKLIVVDEGPDYAVATHPAANALMLAPGLGELLFRAAPDFAVRLSYQFAFAPGFPLSTAFEDRQRLVADTRAMPYAAYRETLLSKQRYVERKPHDIRLRDLGLPALVIFGERDRLYRCAESCERYRAVPDVRVEVLPGVGHTPMVEAPDVTASLIRDFLC